MPTKSLESDATIKSSILSISPLDLNTIQMQMKQYTYNTTHGFSLETIGQTINVYSRQKVTPILPKEKLLFP